MRDYSEYIGIPFLENGRSFLGADCYGLVYLVFTSKLEMNIPTYLNAFRPNRRKQQCIIGKLLEEMNWVEIHETSFPCMALFRIGGFICHCGIVIDDKYMLHTMSGSNSCLEKWNNTLWEKRQSGFFLPRKV